MRIIPFEIEVNYFWRDTRTLSIAIMHFDWPDGDASLLDIGWWMGEFRCEVLWFGFVRFLRRYR